MSPCPNSPLAPVMSVAECRDWPEEIVVGARLGCGVVVLFMSGDPCKIRHQGIETMMLWITG